MQVIRLHLLELVARHTVPNCFWEYWLQVYVVFLVLKVCDLVSFPGDPEHYRSDHDGCTNHKHHYHQYDNEVILSGFLWHVA